MYPTYDMNPIAIRKMEAERLAAMENAKPLSIQPLLAALASIGAFSVAILFLAWVAQ